ncbi:MAG: LPXTG cell wall anchor domain-containing protein, partial [Clostridia bacterium]|nr:LPXTG cell wall anchor domain-containing protein [Clostridia bacterium]
PKEELITLDLPNEAIPEGSGLPQTGQLPAELFVGLGGLITAAGAFLRKK